MQDFSALHSDQTSLAAELGKQYIGTVRFHDFSHFVQTVEQDAVNLMCRDVDILHVAFGVDD